MTDKDIRAENNKSPTLKVTGIPDLRVEYKDVQTGAKKHINIEVDVGYKSNVILSKADNIDNLVWYTDSGEQMNMIKTAVPNAVVNLISL